MCTPALAAGAVDAPVEAPAVGQDTPDFDPGFIISDDAFYNDAAMTEHGVQQFLKSKACVPQDAAPCLTEYRQDTQTKAADPGHCDRYPGAANEPASRIITKVAQACGISPRVLLVLVQKEQSLVMRPSAYGYERATGYGCPDTADCDAHYFGFFNQVYSAAWQFREYTLTAKSWKHHVGLVEVLYSPRQGCGSLPVDIRNQATANLYNYTPYQPNPALLAGPEASGDDCSSYGNLNFSRIYDDWFGDPQHVRFGELWDTCLASPGGRGCPDSVWDGLRMPHPEYPGE